MTRPEPTLAGPKSHSAAISCFSSSILHELILIKTPLLPLCRGVFPSLVRKRYMRRRELIMLLGGTAAHAQQRASGGRNSSLVLRSAVGTRGAADVSAYLDRH